MAKDEIEVEGGKAPAAKKAALPVPLIAAGVIALLGLGFGGFMFMQMNALKAKLAAGPEVQPRGTMPEGEGGVAHAEPTLDPEEVIYEMGEFTANTADGRFARMNISLKIESYYNSAEWEAYEHQQEIYQESLQHYLDMQSGKIGPDGKPIKEKKKASAGPSSRVVALISGAQPAMASEGGEKKAEPAVRPEEPARPMTLAEQKLAEHAPEIRDLIIEQINTHTAAQLTAADGKQEFKQAVIDKLNELLDPRSGQVKELYFSDLVTT